jgi:tetratricopeptide (TPR) repeat protein
MNDKKPFSLWENDLEKLFSPKNKYIFIAGAGISIDPPSNLLPAPQFIRHLLRYCAPEQEIENLLSIESLRYEMIVEVLQRYIDYALEFMDYFELATQPNLIHLFLASVINNGHTVFTTNFDYLIEYALMKILPKEKQKNIVPVITENDYSKYSIPERVFCDGKYPIYKLHGAKRNVITNTKTMDSLITTISAFGKGDTLLSLHTYKKNTIKEISKDHTLVILGYSGGDDFDIAPMLRTLFEMKRIIWIDHQQGDTDEIFQFDPKKAFVIPEGLSQTERLLAEICSNTEAKTYLIRTHTSKFIESILWPLLMPEGSLSDNITSGLSAKSNTPSFEEWISQKFSKITDLIKWKAAADIYLELGFNDDFLRCAETGLKEAEMVNSVRMLPLFYNLLGVYHYNQVEDDKAMSYFEKGLSITTETGRIMLQASQMNNIGLIHLRKKKYDESLSLFKKAFEIAKKRGDYHGMATRLNNIGLVYLEQEKYEKALEKFNDALKYDKKTGDLSGRTIRLKNIGEVYRAKNNYSKALENYRKAYSIVQKLSDRVTMGRILIEMGKTFSLMKDYGKAITNLQKAIKYLKEVGDKTNLLEAEEALVQTKKNLK